MRAPSRWPRRAWGGQGLQSLIGVTLGTGVGGGIVLDGSLVLGYHGTAGEIGHQVIDCNPGAPRCGCGNTGCLEAFVRAAPCEAAGTATAADAFAADERGDRAPARPSSTGSTTSRSASRTSSRC